MNVSDFVFSVSSLGIGAKSDQNNGNVHSLNAG